VPGCQSRIIVTQVHNTLWQVTHSTDIGFETGEGGGLLADVVHGRVAGGDAQIGLTAGQFGQRGGDSNRDARVSGTGLVAQGPPRAWVV
jgi:hypothetical protein